MYLTNHFVSSGAVAHLTKITQRNMLLDPQPDYLNQLNVQELHGGYHQIFFEDYKARHSKKQILDLQADCFSSQLEARGLVGDR
jgi:hypothetical protein